MSTRITTGATVQYWTVTPSASPQTQGNIGALWVPSQAGAGNLTIQGADGSTAVVLGFGATWQGGWVTFPYGVQIVSAWTGGGSLIAAGWGGPPTG